LTLIWFSHCINGLLICSWGVGHSTGLLLVGGVFIVKDYLQSRTDHGSDQDPIDVPDSVGHFFESLVGLFMLGLGMYGFHSALKQRRELQGEIILIPPDDFSEDHDSMESVENDLPVTDTPRYADNAMTGVDHETLVSFRDELMEGRSSQTALEVVSYPRYQDSPPREPRTERIKRWTHRISTKTLAFLAGIIHGLAGPGGVLGIVPAVQLHDWKLAAFYLGSFCISSTLTMGLFACTYGTLSSVVGTKNKWEFQIQCFSSALSFAVGVTWLVLLSLGKLEDVFP
jgi:hypothetical protein